MRFYFGLLSLDWILNLGRRGSTFLLEFVTDFYIDQNAPILSLACSFPFAIAAGTELTNHEASVLMW